MSIIERPNRTGFAIVLLCGFVGAPTLAGIAHAKAPAVKPGITSPLRVVVTIKPIHALVAQVMGETGTPEVLVGGAASPHTFVVKPSDMRKLSRADVVFRVSEAVEPFTIKVAAALPTRVHLVTLLDALGLLTLPQRAGGPFDAHDHGRADAHGPHAHSEHEPDHDQGGSDGHVWLDPANAKAMLDQIARVLGGQRPALAATYLANAAVAKARIDALTADLTRDLAGVVGKPYVVFHDAYQYFEKRFDLDVVGSITVNPDLPPSGQRLSQLRAKIIALGATCVFGEPNFDAKVIRVVTEGTGARTGTLDPEGANLGAGPNLYETLMRNLAASIKGCLDRPS